MVQQSATGRRSLRQIAAVCGNYRSLSGAAIAPCAMPLQYGTKNPRFSLLYTLCCLLRSQQVTKGRLQTPTPSIRQAANAAGLYSLPPYDGRRRPCLPPPPAEVLLQDGTGEECVAVGTILLVFWLLLQCLLEP